MRESEQRPAKCGTHCNLKDSAQRPWRTVEAAGGHAAVPGIRGNGQRFADNTSRLDHDRPRKDTGKVGMQRAAGISEVSAVVAVVRDIPVVGVVVLMMVVRQSRVRHWLRVGAR